MSNPVGPSGDSGASEEPSEAACDESSAPLREAIFEIPPGSAAPRTARQLLDDVMQLWDCDDSDDVAALLTSELVTNVVRHARTDLLLEVSLRACVLRIAATDHDPRLPQPRQPTADAENGRGLHLIETLARSWGVVARPGGKTVWFEIPVTPRPARPTNQG
jgi:anti-sigma regulatory factor (Ser/Thr protein kinase)